MFRRRKPETAPLDDQEDEPATAQAGEFEPIDVAPDTKALVADSLGMLAGSVVSITDEDGSTKHHLKVGDEQVAISEEELAEIHEAQDVWQNPPPGSDPGA